MCELKKLQDELNAEVNRTSLALKAFPRLPNGMTPDHVKASPEFKAAVAQYNVAFMRLRSFNGKYAKQLRKSA